MCHRAFLFAHDPLVAILLGKLRKTSTIPCCRAPATVRGAYATTCCGN
ncbi:hypothetical protein COLSTE_02015 [Collinsella stercoris DSM 13279]|uniref:Uncharacterized protein n=1 Tax=Collinsella stercoris DSM 13279 TaxID=445975 RepID=B6GD36_9ACTN|nr:hypothetical protein COLSTE_02015 [Collinsella stercoris DSM 13279]